MQGRANKAKAPVSWIYVRGKLSKTDVPALRSALQLRISIFNDEKLSKKIQAILQTAEEAM